MRISGRRSDGAFHLSLGGGLSVILKGERVSKAVDEELIAKMGPWHPADNQLSERRRLTAKMELARVVPLETFTLGMSFDETRDAVMAALRSKLGIPSTSAYPVDGPWIPQNGLGSDWVVYCVGGKHYGVTYVISDDGRAEFDSQPVAVTATWASYEEAGEEEDEAHANAFDTAIHAGAYKELKQSAWFRKFMANKKKMMGGKKALDGDHPHAEKEKDANYGAGKKATFTKTENMTVELPGSLPDMNKSV